MTECCNITKDDEIKTLPLQPLPPDEFFEYNIINPNTSNMFQSVTGTITFILLSHQEKNSIVLFLIPRNNYFCQNI
jgi:hypothetical protein